MSRARACVDMPKHLLPGRSGWEKAVYAVLGLSLVGLWVTALVMLA